jgi:hypothetical protein
MLLVTFESDISLASCSDEHLSPNEGLDALLFALFGSTGRPAAVVERS